MTTNARRIKLWDLPTRLFHWSLVVLIAAAIVTGKTGGEAIVWHGRIGLVVLGLLAFRIVWGIVGSTYARFSSFLPTPASIAAYLRGQWKGMGHNPLGALSVLAMLLLIAVQAGTGLFANDDIAFQGPLAVLVDKELSDRLAFIHRLSINALIALIGLHLAAIAFYAHIKKDNLVGPMITGWKTVDDEQDADIRQPRAGTAIAFVFALAVAIGAAYAASGAWIALVPAQ